MDLTGLVKPGLDSFVKHGLEIMRLNILFLGFLTVERLQFDYKILINFIFLKFIGGNNCIDN